MLVTLVGLQNQFTRWCESLISNLIEDSLGPILHSSTSSSEELVQLIIEHHPVRHILVSHTDPRVWSCKVLSAADGFAITALADPRACVRDHSAVPGSKLDDIVRAVASSCAMLSVYLSRPRTLVLRIEDASCDPLCVARRVAHYLGLPIADAEIVNAIEDNSLLFPVAADITWQNEFDEAQRDLIDGALTGYAECFRGSGLYSLVWQPSLFIVGDTHQQLTDAIDISGGSRCLIYGPYIRLPAGRWSADVAIAFAGLDGVKDFTIDVATNRLLDATTISVSRGGIFQRTLPFEIDPENQLPVEVRVSNHQFIVQGRLAFGRVTLQRLPNLSDEALTSLTDTLNSRP